MKDAVGQQEQVKNFWNSKPCDSEVSAKDPHTKDYFQEIENERYRYQPHILHLLSKIDWRNKRVLEIGTGVGTDARKIVELGGVYTGINVDKGSVAMTAKALQIFTRPGEVRQCSAINMEFNDASFDVVYSFGVLHHIPEIKKAVSEIFRVLKPNGELVIMVYNKSSINYYIEILFLRRLFLRLLVLPGAIKMLSLLGFPREKLKRHVEIYRTSKKMSSQEWLSRNTDGPDNPYSCVYGAKDVQDAFKNFKIVSNEVYYFEYRHWGVLGRLLPAFLVSFLGSRWGWHRVVRARKPA